MPTLPPASDIAAQLANNVEWFCRRYLSNGYRSGRYWCGAVANPQRLPRVDHTARMVPPVPEATP